MVFDGLQLFVPLLILEVSAQQSKANLAPGTSEETYPSQRLLC